MHLDNRTVAIVGTFVALAVSLPCVLIWRLHQTYPGFGRWTLANSALPARQFFTWPMGVPSPSGAVPGHENVRAR